MAVFQASARAVDMLGRQQIAGVPTAINELFKNAYDAFATSVDADYFPNERAMLIQDNGEGMTRQDFEGKWLVLGTDSKFRKNTDNDNEARPVLGEKGVGRLSMAAIGRVAIVLTRARDARGRLASVVAAIVHWGEFELPGVRLEQIQIPVREFSTVPTNCQIVKLRDELVDSLRRLCDKGIVGEEDVKPILDDLNAIPAEVGSLIEKCELGYSLQDHSGTTFIILGLNAVFDEDLTGKVQSYGGASKLERFLVGFSNTMTPGHPELGMDVAFRTHADVGLPAEVIDKEGFFTPEDFQAADHHFSGKFDECGQFKGTVTLFNSKTVDVQIPWSGNDYKPTKCGPFSVEISYLQGNVKDSSLSMERYEILSHKLERFAGLYIYRDGVRILPYGNNDYDFLDIELNRTKSASYYFFSYRNMFGAVNISKKYNAALQEKAGREGLIENIAYRQLRDILQNFFVNLAADFFRDPEKGGKESAEFWMEFKKERNKMYKALKQRAKRTAEKKEKFLVSLNSFFTVYNAGGFDNEAEQILKSAENKLKVAASVQDKDHAASAFIEVESDARDQLQKVRSRTIVKMPVGISLKRDQRADWDAYLDVISKWNADTFPNYERRLADLVDRLKNSYGIQLSTRKRVVGAVTSAVERVRKAAEAGKRNVRSSLADSVKNIRSKISDVMQEMENTLSAAQMNLSALKEEDLGKESVATVVERIVTPLQDKQNEAEKVFSFVTNLLAGIDWQKMPDGQLLNSQDLLDAAEGEIEELRNENVRDSELVQLGLAVNIVHHEFANSVKSLRNAIRGLKKMSEANHALAATYETMKTNFAHLDHYLSLLTPFSRRISQEKEIIKTDDIFFFVKDVFSGRFERHGIECVRTNRFTLATVDSYRSVLYPVFVNIVDNAIHWLLTMAKSDKKLIRLNCDTEGNLYVSNNGPQIKIADREKIFDYGFTRKVAGRGIGLAVSRKVLKDAGYGICICTPLRDDETVCFKIYPLSEEGDENA